IALVTGAAWGKPMWGTWWVWDARLTSELVLLFLYAGVIALWHAFDDRKMAGRAAGILVLVGVVNLPVIHYSVEWWNTLHQGSTRMQQSIDPAMRSPLRWAIAGYLLLFIYAGVIALWHAFDDRKMAGRAAGILVLVGVVNLPVIHYSVEWWNTLHQGSTRMQQSIDPAMRSPLRWAIAGYLLLFMTLALMRMRNLILLMEKRRPWVSELILKRGHR
ncbi:cytochrome c biogenesis protein CcsA, partial [Salmonella enterica]|uniref:cytochrome c biogenesis protein CcsA n=1 Tax=Salmonella enterica TaxID=28901 RepID=UPI001F120C98